MRSNMRKIFIIFAFMILVGCTNEFPSFNDKVSITLNITSEVDPIITPSRGEGVYDSSNKSYKITVPNSAPLDISLSHEDYQTLTLTFTSGELLEGDIIRNVEFGKEQTAKVVINIITEAETKDIQIENFEYTNSSKKFTINFPNRNIDTVIKVSAPGYKTFEIPITPEDLVVGYFDRTILLAKENEIVISLKVKDYYYIPLYNLYTNEEIVPSMGSGYAYYVVNKGDELVYSDQLLNSNVYLKADQDIEIFPYGDINAKKYYIQNDPFMRDGTLYYEYNNVRYKAVLEPSEQGLKTNIPIGSKILIVKGNRFAYTKTIETSEILNLNKDAFNEFQQLDLKVKVFDLLNNKFINSFNDYKNKYTAIDGYFKISNTEVMPSDYIFDNLDLLYQQYINNEWVTMINAYPIAEGIIIKCLDMDGNPIMNDDKDYLIYELSSNNGFLLDLRSAINYEDREISFSYRNYLPNLDYQQIDGKYYYVVSDPVVINTNLYEFTILINGTDYMEIKIEIGDTIYNVYQPSYYTYFIDTSKIDYINITFSHYKDKETKYSYITKITLTDELIKRGFIRVNSQAEIEPNPNFTVTAGEGIEIIDISVNHGFFYIEGNRVYYLYSPISIEVTYIKDNIVITDYFTFYQNKSNYIIE